MAARARPGSPASRFDDPELIVPREDETLPVARLEPWLRAHLEGAEGALTVAQFGGGHANLTYLLRFGQREFVLRRPPLGPVAPGAHDMGREHRVLSRLHAHFDLAPRSYLHCTDGSLIGAPFQIMERRRGQVIRRRVPARYARDPALLRRVGFMLVEVLARLHRVDREAAGLGDLGHPEGFLQRQLEGWSERWHAAAHEPNAEMDALVDWLRGTLPSSAPATLLHNDFKLDNLLLSRDDPTVPVAILDWDMCTSGDPLADLGYLLNQWVEAGDPQAWIAQSSLPSHLAGFPSRAEVVARYAERTATDTSRIEWYYAFSAMKFAAVIQQIFIRYLRGQTRDPRFARYDERARIFVRKGCAIAGIGRSPSGTTTP